MANEGILKGEREQLEGLSLLRLGFGNKTRKKLKRSLQAEGSFVGVRVRGEFSNQGKWRLVFHRLRGRQASYFKEKKGLCD